MAMLNLEKSKTKTRSKGNMYSILGKWGCTIDTGDLKIRNQSMCDMDTDYMNQHHEKMYHRVCVCTWKVLRVHENVTPNIKKNLTKPYIKQW